MTHAELIERLNALVVEVATFKAAILNKINALDAEMAVINPRVPTPLNIPDTSALQPSDITKPGGA